MTRRTLLSRLAATLGLTPLLGGEKSVPAGTPILACWTPRGWLGYSDRYGLVRLDRHPDGSWQGSYTLEASDP